MRFPSWTVGQPRRMQHSEHLIRSRVFFGHQSVGADLLQELQALRTARNGSFPIEELAQTGAVSCTQPAVLHARLGANGDAASKISAFVAWLQGGLSQSIDTALMKFCYVDITSSEQARSVFGRYVDAMSTLAAAYPQLNLLHCSVPIRRLPSGPYALTRRMLGHRHPELERNAAREWFNQRLREKYGPKVFDLAGLECTYPDGRRCTQKMGAIEVPGLVPTYTNDGGHLNEQGRRIAALAFLDFLQASEKN